MNFTISAIVWMAAGLMMVGCNQPDQKEAHNDISGEWAYGYQLMEDNNKNFETPYNLLGFEYSDGFILKEDGTGQVVWYEKVNGDFEWEKTEDQLIFKITRTENDIEKFEFKFSDLTDTSMLLKSPGEKRYFMERKE